MADIDLKTETPDTTLPSTGFLFGADSQASASPSVYSTQAVATTLLGSTSLTGATVTTSQPLLNLAQTWNAGAVTFTGWRLNVTDTASAAGSLLMDLQVGGATRLNVDKSGSARVGSGGGFVLTQNGAGITGNRSGLFSDTGAGGTLFLSGLIQFSANAVDVGGAVDTFLGRRAAANLRLGAADDAAPVAQTLSVQGVVAGTTNTAGVDFTLALSVSTGSALGGAYVITGTPAGGGGFSLNTPVRLFDFTPSRAFNVYNTFTDALNYERGFVRWSSNVLQIGSEGLGTGSGRTTQIRSGGDLEFFNGSRQVMSVSGNFPLWMRGATGTIAFSNSNDVTIYRSRAKTFTLAGNNTAGDDMIFSVGGETSSFPALKRVSANLQVIAADNAGSAGFIVGNQALATTATDGFIYVPTCAGTPTGTPTAQTGTAPIVVDTTNNKLYFYSGGAWRDAGP